MVTYQTDKNGHEILIPVEIIRKKLLSDMKIAELCKEFSVTRVYYTV